jgi:hypothetical protein
MSVHPSDEELLEPSATTEAHLATCETCASRRDAHRTIRASLAELPRHAEIPAVARALLETRRRRSRTLQRAAVVGVSSAVVCAMLGAWFALHGPREALPKDLAEELALDHLHYEHHIEAAAVRGDPNAISAYFARTLGFAPHYGAIEAATFEGGKPCRIAGRWTALAWLDRAGHWLSLFTMPNHAMSARGCASAEGVHVCGAPDPNGGARVLVGDLSEAEMMRLVDESLQ